MENVENKKCLNIDNNEQNLKSCYKLDYEGQPLNNAEFIKWKKDMLEKYGKDAKLFKCKEENILFYITNEECKSNPAYKYNCPSCKKSICYFCSRSTKIEDDNGKCCIKRRIIYLISNSGFMFIKENNEDYNCMRFFLLIPFVNLLYLINFFSSFLFYRLYDKSCEEEYPSMYEDHFKNKNNYILILIIIINALCAFMLSICFMLIFSYFVIFIFLISILFKEYPSKYIIGILYDGFRF